MNHIAWYRQWKLRRKRERVADEMIQMLPNDIIAILQGSPYVGWKYLEWLAFWEAEHDRPIS